MANPLNATFFSLRKRERSGVLTMASIAFALLYLGIYGAFAYFNRGAVADYVTWIGTLSSQTVDVNGPQFAMPPASVLNLAPAYLLLTFVLYISTAAYEAACLRWMIRGETGGVFGLSLGADTWRVYLSYWIWFFLLIAYYIVCVIVIGGVVVGIGAATGGGAEGLAPLLMLAPLLVLGGLIFFGVRFAPAAATSVALKRFAFFDAWTVTKGRFWELLGSFALLILMYVVASIIAWVVAAASIGFAVFSRGVSDPDATHQEILDMLARPETLIPVIAAYAGFLIVVFVLLLALFGVNARAAQAAIEDGKIKPAGA